MSGSETKKRALVTGATSGIGRALCGRLADRGVDVFATGRDSERLRALMEKTGCKGASFDLSDPEAPARLYGAAKSAWGAAPDFVINNAGYNSRPR